MAPPIGLAHSARRPARLTCALAVCALAVPLLLCALPAGAQTTYESPYTAEQTFNAAFRLLRVDLGFKVTERDPGAGYLLFDYRSRESGERSSPGSIEVVPTGHNTVRVIVQLAQMPRYHEEVLMNELTRKLRADYGEPVHPADRPVEPPDAGRSERDD